MHHLILPVEPAHFPALADLWERSVRATHHFLSESDIQRFKPLVRDQYLGLVNLRAWHTGRGWAGFVGTHEGKIEMLFVEPELRGQGIGTALLDWAIEDVGARLVDVNEQNPDALGFYLHRGFEVFDRSELDPQGEPFPILHLRLADSGH